MVARHGMWLGTTTRFEEQGILACLCSAARFLRWFHTGFLVARSSRPLFSVLLLHAASLLLDVMEDMRKQSSHDKYTASSPSTWYLMQTH